MTLQWCLRSRYRKNQFLTLTWVIMVQNCPPKLSLSIIYAKFSWISNLRHTSHTLHCKVSTKSMATQNSSMTDLFTFSFNFFGELHKNASSPKTPAKKQPTHHSICVEGKNKWNTGAGGQACRIPVSCNGIGARDARDKAMLCVWKHASALSQLQPICCTAWRGTCVCFQAEFFIYFKERINVNQFE